MRHSSNERTEPAVLTAEPEEGTSILLQISNAIVGLHKSRVGRGPTKARTHIEGDMVICVLRGGMARADQTLLESGRGDCVFEHQHLLQQAIRAEAMGIIERLLGRKVLSYMDGSDPQHDIQVEIFVLEPEPEPEAFKNARFARENARETVDEHRALRAEHIQAREQLRRKRDRV